MSCWHSFRRILVSESSEISESQKNQSAFFLLSLLLNVVLLLHWVHSLAAPAFIAPLSCNHATPVFATPLIEISTPVIEQGDHISSMEKLSCPPCAVQTQPPQTAFVPTSDSSSCSSSTLYPSSFDCCGALTRLLTVDTFPLLPARMPKVLHRQIREYQEQHLGELTTTVYNRTEMQGWNETDSNGERLSLSWHPISVDWEQSFFDNSSKSILSFQPYNTIPADPNCGRFFFIKTNNAAGLGHRVANIFLAQYLSMRFGLTYVFPGFDMHLKSKHTHHTYIEADMFMYGLLGIKFDYTYEQIMAMNAGKAREDLSRIHLLHLPYLVHAAQTPNAEFMEAAIEQFYTYYIKPVPKNSPIPISQYNAIQQDAHARKYCNLLFTQGESFWNTASEYPFAQLYQRIRMAWKRAKQYLLSEMNGVTSLKQLHEVQTVPFRLIKPFTSNVEHIPDDTMLANPFYLTEAASEIHRSDLFHIAMHIRVGDMNSFQPYWFYRALDVVLHQLCVADAEKNNICDRIRVWVICEDPNYESLEKIRSLHPSVTVLDPKLTPFQVMYHLKEMSVFIGCYRSSFSTLLWNVQPSAVAILNYDAGTNTPHSPVEVQKIRHKRQVWLIRQQLDAAKASDSLQN